MFSDHVLFFFFILVVSFCCFVCLLSQAQCWVSILSTHRSKGIAKPGFFGTQSSYEPGYLIILPWPPHSFPDPQLETQWAREGQEDSSRGTRKTATPTRSSSQQVLYFIVYTLMHILTVACTPEMHAHIIALTWEDKNTVCIWHFAKLQRFILIHIQHQVGL